MVSGTRQQNWCWQAAGSAQPRASRALCSNAAQAAGPRLLCRRRALAASCRRAAGPHDEPACIGHPGQPKSECAGEEAGSGCRAGRGGGGGGAWWSAAPMPPTPAPSDRRGRGAPPPPFQTQRGESPPGVRCVPSQGAGAQHVCGWTKKLRGDASKSSTVGCFNKGKVVFLARWLPLFLSLSLSPEEGGSGQAECLSQGQAPGAVRRAVCVVGPVPFGGRFQASLR